MAVGGYRECDHAAPVAGRMTVFASVEFPRDSPPDRIVIDGVPYVREDKQQTSAGDKE